VRRAAALAMAVALAGCPEQAGPTQDPNAILAVNGEVVPRADFELELSRELASSEGGPQRTPEQLEPYKQALVETLIERTLLLQAAARQGVTVTPEEVDRRILALSSEYPAESFEGALAQAQTTRTELEKKTRAQLTIEKLVREQVYARVAVTEETIRGHYEEHAADYAEEESVHAAQIVVKGLDEAKRLQGLLWNGKKFQDLARKYSLSPEARVGGDLGFFARGVMPGQFDQVVFGLAVGQVSDVIATDFGFHLFKVLEKKPARKKELPEVRDQIEESLLKELHSKEQDNFVKDLRSKAEVKVNAVALQSVTGRARALSAQEP
jgi:peptidyl-prolyl cis-trans isomerase C